MMPSQQLLFLGTVQHGRLPSNQPLPQFESPVLPDFVASPAGVITPGFIEFSDWIPGESESDDEHGFHAMPAVYLGGDPGLPLTQIFPTCLCCQRKMNYVGQLETDAFSDDVYSRGLVLLYCPACQVQCCLDLE